MTAYFVRRFLLIIPTFIGITLAVFRRHAVRAGRTGRARDHELSDGRDDRGRRRRIGDRPRRATRCPRSSIEEIRRYYGFDKPVHIRYGMWLWNVLHLDLGRSYVYQDPVWDVIKSRFPVSIFLGLTGFFLSYLVCVPLGVLKAVRHGSRFDWVSSVVVFLGYAIPGWALGTALLVLLRRRQLLGRVSARRLSGPTTGST